ncbi:MAG: TonB-dependent receptor [Bacteroidota bacterium]
MKHFVLIFFVFLLLPVTLSAQVALTGRVLSEGEPVAFANVVISDTSDAIVTGVITEEDGSFSLQLEQGTYKVSISFLGYQSFEQQIDLQDAMSLGDVVLQSAATELEGVEIIAKAPLIQRKTDRIIFNVEQSVAAAGGDAVDALKQAPGIVVRDNTIAMFGKSGMRLMVDGRILQLTGDEMFNFLNAIQSKDIKSIEVITNPPAKYEVEGSGGLINIILKKGLSDSWKNTISAAYKQIELGEITVGNNFKYRRGKVNILAIANGLFGNQRYLQDQELFYSNNTWDIETTQERDLKNISGRVLFDVNLTEHSTLGFQVSAGYNRPFWDDIANTEIRNNAGQIDSIINSVGVRDSKVDNYTANVHYYTRLDTMGRNLSFDVDFFNYKTQDIRDVLATTFLGDG